MSEEEPVGPHNTKTYLSFNYGSGRDPDDTRDSQPGFHLQSKTDPKAFAQSCFEVMTYTREEAEEGLERFPGFKIVPAVRWTTARCSLPKRLKE